MKDLSFEQALTGLEEIVVRLEKGGIPLEDSVKLYEEGSRLAQICQSKLSKVEERLKELVKTAGGFELKEVRVGEE